MNKPRLNWLRVTTVTLILVIWGCTTPSLASRHKAKKMMNQGPPPPPLSLGSGTTPQFTNAMAITNNMSIFSFCNPGSAFCMTVERDFTSDWVSFTLQTSVPGWVAVGLGSNRMAGASMYVALKDSNGNIQVSQRSSVGHGMPKPLVDPTNLDSLVVLPKHPSAISIAPEAQLVASFARPMTDSGFYDMSPTSPIKFIFAYSKMNPKTPDSPDSDIGFHTGFGSFKMDLSKPGVFKKIFDQPEEVSADTILSSPSSSSSSTAAKPTKVSAVDAEATDVATSAPANITGQPSTDSDDVDDVDAQPSPTNSTTTSTSTPMIEKVSSMAKEWLSIVKGWGKGIFGREKNSTSSSTPTVLPMSTLSLTMSLAPTTTPPKPTKSGKIKTAKTTPTVSDSGTSKGALSSTTKPSKTKSASVPSKSNTHSETVEKAEDEGTAFEEDNSDFYYKIHGVCMFVAWAVFPAIGIFVARHLKDVLGVWWYRLHLICMIAGTITLTIVGFIAIQYTESQGSTRFSAQSPHKLLGIIIVMGLLPLQTLLGFISNALWNPKRQAIPWWDYAHHWLGRLSVGLALVEILMGLGLYGVSGAVIAMYVAYLLALVVLFVVGHYTYGVAWHGAHTKAVAPRELGYNNIESEE